MSNLIRLHFLYRDLTNKCFYNKLGSFVYKLSPTVFMIDICHYSFLLWGRMACSLFLLTLAVLNMRMACVSQTANGRSTGTDLWNFGVILEAGQKASNLRIYHWPDYDGNRTLFDVRQLRGKNGQPVVVRSAPGLSAFASNPDRAAKYVDPLLRFAENIIPEVKQAETPLFILGTEGLRRLQKRWDFEPDWKISPEFGNVIL